MLCCVDRVIHVFFGIMSRQLLYVLIILRSLTQRSLQFLSDDLKKKQTLAGQYRPRCLSRPGQHGLYWTIRAGEQEWTLKKEANGNEDRNIVR